MDFTGRFDSLVVDYSTKRQKIALSVNEDATGAYEDLKDCELSISIKKYRKKRSLDANSYYWVLLSKLSKKIETSMPELHNQMLCRYGEPEIIDGKTVKVVLPDTKQTEKDVRFSQYYHLKPTTQVVTMADEKDYRTHILMRGSSSFDTAEMAKLIDGLISECKDAKIPDREIATPDEMRLLKEKYNIEL